MSLVGQSEGYIEYDGELHDTDIFKIDESGEEGSLHVTDEIEITYDRVTEEWSGEAIRSDGWVDIDTEELWFYIVAYELESRIKGA